MQIIDIIETLQKVIIFENLYIKIYQIKIYYNYQYKNVEHLISASIISICFMYLRYLYHD